MAPARGWPQAWMELKPATGWPQASLEPMPAVETAMGNMRAAAALLVISSVRMRVPR